MNYELFRAIRQKGLRQRDFAKVVHDHESVVSRVISGSLNPNPMRRLKYARALGMRVEELFEEEIPNRGSAESGHNPGTAP